jgi:leader peptidase (prepilin peptidase)/N-methyltransferase
MFAVTIVQHMADQLGGVQGLLEPPVFAWVALVFGLVVGSFANVCIHRLPLGLSVVRPRSRCPLCAHEITALENLPVLSWLALRGRCRACRAPISPRYPLVEALNGAGYAALAAWFGPSLHTVVLMGFFTSLLVLALIDLDHHILPDVITLPGIVVGLLASLLPGAPTPLDAALSAAAGYVGFWAVATLYQRTRGVEGLGQGDWKMVAMLGAFLGWQPMLLTVFFAALSGTIVGVALMLVKGRSGRHALPLGTFLAAGGMATLFVGAPLLAWYRGLLRV